MHDTINKEANSSLDNDPFLKELKDKIQCISEIQNIEGAKDRLSLEKDVDITNAFQAAEQLTSGLNSFSSHKKGIPIVGVMGHFSSGKSSFLNELLKHFGYDEDLLETGDHPTTKGLHFITHSDNINSIERIQTLETRLPVYLHGLEVEELKDVILLDTPGAGEIGEDFEWVVINYLMLCDCLLYTVQAMTPLSKVDFPLLEHYFEHLDFMPIHFIVTFGDHFRLDPDSPTSKENIDYSRFDTFVDGFVNRLTPVKIAASSKAEISRQNFNLVDNIRSYGFDETNRSVQKHIESGDFNVIFNGKLKVYRERAKEIHACIADFINDRYSQWSQSIHKSEEYADQFECMNNHDHLYRVMGSFSKCEDKIKSTQSRRKFGKPKDIDVLRAVDDQLFLDNDIYNRFYNDLKDFLVEKMASDLFEFQDKNRIVIANIINDIHLELEKKDICILRKDFYSFPKASNFITSLDGDKSIIAKETIEKKLVHFSGNINRRINEHSKDLNTAKETTAKRIGSNDALNSTLNAINELRQEISKMLSSQLDLVVFFTSAITDLSRYSIASDVNAAQELEDRVLPFTVEQRTALVDKIITSYFSPYDTQFQKMKEKLAQIKVENTTVLKRSDNFVVNKIVLEKEDIDTDEIFQGIKKEIALKLDDNADQEKDRYEKLINDLNDMLEKAINHNKLSSVRRKKYKLKIGYNISLAALLFAAPFIAIPFLTEMKIMGETTLTILLALFGGVPLYIAGKRYRNIQKIFSDREHKIIKYVDLKDDVDRRIDKYQHYSIAKKVEQFIEDAVNSTLTNTIKKYSKVVNEKNKFFGEEVVILREQQNRINAINKSVYKEYTDFIDHAEKFIEKKEGFKNELNDNYNELFKNRMSPSRQVVTDITKQIEKLADHINKVQF